MLDRPDEAAFAGHWEPVTAASEAVVARVVEAVAEAERAGLETERAAARAAGLPLPRARRKDAQERFNLAMRAVVAEAVLVCHVGGQSGIFVPRRRDYLNTFDRYRHPSINPQLPEVLDALAGLAFVEQELGGISDDGERRRTVVRPGAALVALLAGAGLDEGDFGRDVSGEAIVLREGAGDDRRTVPYTDDGDTQRWRAEMTAINDALARADILVADGAGVDGQRRFLQRIFSRGSFAFGGRLYGGFWQEMSGENRRTKLLIDGEPVVELDFAAYGLHIAYGLAGVQPPEGDLYHLPMLPGARREDVKRYISAALNPFGDYGAVLRKCAWNLTGVSVPADSGLEGMAEVEAMRRADEAVWSRHAGLVPLLGDPMLGLRIQRKDSDVLVAILLRLADRGITALPVHDSLVVAETRAEEAREIMATAFREMIGHEPVIVEKRGDFVR